MIFSSSFRLDKKTKDLQIAERNATIYESRCGDLQSQFNQSQAERKKLAERERELEKEVERLKALLDDCRKNLEEETLQRIDLENHIQSLKEDISFKDQVYQQELTETRTRRQVSIAYFEVYKKVAQLSGISNETTFFLNFFFLRQKFVHQPYLKKGNTTIFNFTQDEYKIVL